MSSSPTKVDALSQSVVVIGLNAALQKRFILPPNKNLEPGNVHRAHQCETGVGGKGQDVGVAMSCLLSQAPQTTLNSNDKDKAVLLAQFLGMGPEGDAVSNTLRTRHGLSDALTIRNAAPLRTCTTIVGADEATELVETSGEVTDDEMKALQSKVEEMTKEGGKAGCVCIMGSMPPGCAEDTYADLTSRLAGKRSLVLIDSVIGLDPLLGALATIYDTNNDDGSSKKEGGAVLKLNAAELCKLAGVTKGAGEADQVTMEELTASTQGFVTNHANAIGALDYLCITDGKWPGYLIEIPKSASASFRTWQLPAVDLSKEGMLYPIGAGDTVAAGTLAAWQYLHHQSTTTAATGGGGDNNFFGVVPSKIGTHLADRKAEWSSAGAPSSSSSLEEDEGYKMATAFAFGLACGSASCLQQENSVFEVDDAVKFFGGMVKPVVQ
eukprot:CAMPEP_0201869278 /NCGR_PEP_ID=MMETSP0902-20130614/2852_1 /ASSEMBLY_ACC=CAM_ASM_000551 /TAXON_ID=420261 /ORGANISM="Thalassiosira antarctica, Strain CCMP982" /LENGTH=437 /DNA_ID=CAMNT_0048394757 /DNA_START=24 /DNA_END=1337 /DNA_ORIENTATION=-